MSSQHGAKRIRANPAPAGGGALAAAVLRDVLLDMVVSRTCRIRRKVFMVSVACFGFVCLLTYSFASSCCSLVVAIQPGSVPWSGPLVSRPASPTAGRGDESPSGRAVHSRDRQENPNGFHFRHRNINDVKRMSGGQGTGDDQTYDDDDDEQDNVYVDESADNYDDGGGWGEFRFQSSQKTRTTIGEDLKNATKKLPRAIIIGVKKGGTRAVLAFLQVHPNVRAPGPEPHFFDRHYHRGLDWYRNKMPPTLAGHITIEKTPSYFVTKEVPRRIFNMSKDVKLIVVVRDPVTRAISDYTQTASKRPGVKQFEHMVFMNNTTRIVDTSWAAIRIGVYAKHLDQWFQFFPLKQMHFVSGERLISDPAGEMAKLQDFLGLKRVITDNHFVFDETKGFPCLRKPEGTGRSHCLGKTKGRQHPQIHPHVLKRLRDFYRPFNAKFYQMVRQDFGWS